MKNKLIRLVSVLLDKKLVRFFLVSGINTLFGYGLFAILLYLGIIYSIALLISTITGVLFNFNTLRSLVFKNKKNSLLFKFIGVYIVTYLCNLCCMSIFNYFNFNLYLGGAILVIPVGLLTYTLNNNLVFKN